MNDHTGNCHCAGCMDRFEAWRESRKEASTPCETDLEQAIRDFRITLPGYWFSLGECDVSCDASCAPTRQSPDIALIPRDQRFNEGFHADVPQPSTLAEALCEVVWQALSARAALNEAPQ